MKLKYRILALVCAVWIAFLPSLAFSQASTVGNDANPTAPGGVRLLGTDGTYDRKMLLDSSGRPDVLSGYPLMDVLQHRTNVTVTTALPNDSSAVAVDTRGYRQLYVLIRSKAATFGAAPISLQLACRAVSQAAYDSTAAGWWYGLGKGSKYGKTLPMLDLNDRWKMIPLTDSLTFTPFVAPYTGIYLVNQTGAQWIGDTWLLGVR